MSSEVHSTEINTAEFKKTLKKEMMTEMKTMCISHVTDMQN